MFSVVSASELCVVPILLGISVELPFHLFYYFDVVLADFLLLFLRGKNPLLAALVVGGRATS